MSHDCVSRINALLASRNTALAGAFSFNTPSRELIQLSTVKADAKVRGRPVSMFASFCPFCGVRLNNGSET